MSAAARRIVTGHTTDGTAVVWKDEEVTPKPIQAGDWEGRYAHLWTTDSSPWDNADERDLAQNEDGKKLSNQSGSVLRVVDFPAGKECPFHRTVSLDYGILMEGEIVLILDNKKELKMKAGDVQRGTIHAWRNDTATTARMYFILLAAKPLEFGEKKFDDAGYHAQ